MQYPVARAATLALRSSGFDEFDDRCWHREAEREPNLRDVFDRMVEYRRHVLSIFESLVGYDSRTARVQ